MGPLTPQLLMQRGRPKSDRLGKIRNLDLSGLELLPEHLDPKLLSRLTHLQELDVSNNRLDTLPPDLGLGHLRILDCAHNQLTEVTTLVQFPQLEELVLEGNPFLTISDNLKAAFLLPKLRKFNGKDATSVTAQAESLNRELCSRVTAHWEKFMASKSPEEATEKAQAEFVSSAVQDVRYGPESLREFTQWRVQKISEEMVASGRSYVPDPERPLRASEPRTRQAALKRLDNSAPCCGPSKRVCTSLLGKIEVNPGDSESQPDLELEPLHFLQCHSKNNSPRDLDTQLWACAFEPSWEEGAMSQTVATCGGEAVCVIDCQTGIVLHKYKALGEEFFSVAWTSVMVVTQSGHKKRWSVLAAAGLRGLVRLLNIRAGFCCGVIRAHKKAIATLCFSPTCETHLFTASYDKRVILWDIGELSQDYEFYSSTPLLTLDVASIPLRLCPVASCPDTYLMAGCEGGCCCWDIRLDQPDKKRSCEVEFVFEGTQPGGQRVDGLAFVNKDVVASKGGGLGAIVLWSWSQTWAARGSRDFVAVVVLARLQWSPTDLAYFSLSACPDEGIVLCGDEEGSVWIYDVRHILAQPLPLTTAPQAPIQILRWPKPCASDQVVTKTMVNTVVADPSFSYLTALTDSNIVAIWKRL